MGDQVVIEVSLLFIAWESGASYLDQSHSEVKQNQCNSGKISTLSLKLLERLISWVGDDSQLTRAFSPYYVCIGRHQPRPQREEDWKEKNAQRKNEITKSYHDNSIESRVPLTLPWRSRPSQTLFAWLSLLPFPRKWYLHRSWYHNPFRNA